MENNKFYFDWLLIKTEQCSNRYIEAEKFIIELSEMNLFQRLFCNGKIIKFLESRKKYNF